MDPPLRDVAPPWYDTPAPSKINASNLKKIDMDSSIKKVASHLTKTSKSIYIKHIHQFCNGLQLYP